RVSRRSPKVGDKTFDEEILVKGRITKDHIAMLSNWRHSGFQVFCGQRIFPQDETAIGKTGPGSFKKSTRSIP
ncbi:MAG: hypothetical protein NTX30_07070, partial [Deltaproteobacteria bacterium]|nr:hypothetical protein [Deltaproteobacteria bacterium]